MPEAGPGQNKENAPDVKALVARAITEVTQDIQKKGKFSDPALIDEAAREMVNSSYQYALGYHRKNPPSPQVENPLLKNDMVPESTKEILRKSQSQIGARLEESRRSYIAAFFTISGVSQETANALADIIIAGA